jgi:hypothetical protein
LAQAIAITSLSLRDFEKGQRKGQQFSRPWANDAERHEDFFWHR